MTTTKDFLESLQTRPFYYEEDVLSGCQITYTTYSYELTLDKGTTLTRSKSDKFESETLNRKTRKIAITRVPLSEIYKGNIPGDDYPIPHPDYIPTEEIVKRVKHVTKFFPPNTIFTNLLVLVSDKLYTKEQYLYYLNYAFKNFAKFGDHEFTKPKDIFHYQTIDSNINHVLRTYDTTTTFADIGSGLIGGSSGGFSGGIESSSEGLGTQGTATTSLTEPTNLFKNIGTYFLNPNLLGDEPAIRTIPVLDMLHASRNYPHEHYLGSLTNEEYAKFIKTYTVKAYNLIVANNDVYNSVLDSFMGSKPYNLELVADALSIRDPNYRSNPFD